MATKTAAKTNWSPSAAKSYMLRNLEEARDHRTGEVSSTQLAENAAAAFGQNQIDGPLDDPDHWVWEVAVEVSETAVIRASGLFTPRAR